MKLLIASSFAVASAGPFRDWSGYSLSQYQADFNKANPPANGENRLRQGLFESRLKEVLAQNSKYSDGSSTWWAEINEFSDWTEEELRKLSKGQVNIDKGEHPVSTPLGGMKANPSRVDWRDKSPSVVTPVKNQGGCGSCWAFGSTEVLESHYAIATGDLLVLAPQAYVNCAPNPKHCGGTGGCEGSIPELAFNWSASKGLPLESNLPYAAHDEQCKPYKAAVKNGGYTKLPENDAAALETAVATIGPIAVNVAASPWSSYGGGIFSGGCSADNCILNHIVALEGYDTQEGYWLVRNSWGTSWGEDGYIKLTRKNDGVTYTDTRPGDGVACEPFPKVQHVMGESGVLFDTSYPTQVSSAAEITVV